MASRSVVWPLDSPGCRRCSCCKRVLPLSVFGPRDARISRSACCECENIRSKYGRTKHSATLCAHTDRHAKGRGLCQSCYDKRRRLDPIAHQKERASAKRHYAKMRTAILAHRKAWGLSIKLEMIAAYGGACCCCGETESEFLTLDHHGPIGRKLKAEHRKWGTGLPIYVRLRRIGWPKEGLRLLCMNCNWAERRGAICPHSRKKARTA